MRSDFFRSLMQQGSAMYEGEKKPPISSDTNSVHSQLDYYYYRYRERERETYSMKIDET